MAERIEINPSVMLGKPVVRNTRIPVELVLRKLSEGAAIADLLDAYPRLTEADTRACLEYAADTVAHDEVYPLVSD
ncbi:MAG: DUF433 domain-containing protein [bacterium]|nr:DUF433 domain-containing protein [bacterium]